MRTEPELTVQLDQAHCAASNVGPTARLTWFTAACFAIAWIPWCALRMGADLPSQVALVGMFAPAISALIVALICDGPRGVTMIVGKLARVRFGAKWWFLAILVMPAVYGLAAVSTAKQQEVHLLVGPKSWWFLPLSFAYLVVVTAGEEIGWRGYALPLLLKRFPAVIAALGLGLVWGIWHVPLRSVSGQSAFTLPLFLTFTMALSVIYLILQVRAAGSLFPALLLHASTDLAPRVIDLSTVGSAYWIVVDVILAATAGLLWHFALGSHGREGSVHSSPVLGRRA